LQFSSSGKFESEKNESFKEIDFGLRLARKRFYRTESFEKWFLEYPMQILGCGFMHLEPSLASHEFGQSPAQQMCLSGDQHSRKSRL
jgi:hypothetical protein